MKPSLYLLFFWMGMSCQSTQSLHSFTFEKSKCLGNCLPYTLSFQKQYSKIEATLVLREQTVVFELSQGEKKKLKTLMRAINWRELEVFYGRRGETDR